MKIGILQTGHAPDEVLGTLGNYDQMFEKLLDGHGLEFETYAVVDGAFPDGPEVCDGWLITGSRHGAYEDHPWIAPLEDLIRAIRDARRPLVGICFGHQIIAQALGGRVEKYVGGWAVGRQDYDFNGETLALNAWHQDQVTALPPGAQVEARNPFCAHAALSYGARIFTVQPHPEFGAAMIEALITHRGKALPPALIEEARAGLDRPVAADRIARRLVATLKGAPA